MTRRENVRTRSKQIEYENAPQDSKYIMFEDRSPAALQHYLVIPRDHIGKLKRTSRLTRIDTFLESVRTLNRTDVELG